MLQAEDARPTTDAGMAALMEGLKGNGRRTAIRAIGRIERPEMIALIAPALNDGVGIRAEAANALAQMARTPAAVAEVQKLLLARAATDASLNTWESWGEIAAALGRLPYDTAAQVAETEAVLLTGLPAPDSLNDVETAALVGSARGLESLARTVRAKKLPPLGERDLGSAALGGDGAAPGRRSALGDHAAAGHGGAGDRQPGDRVGDRARAERCRRRGAPLCRGRSRQRCAHRRSAIAS